MCSIGEKKNVETIVEVEVSSVVSFGIVSNRFNVFIFKFFVVLNQHF